MTVKLPINYLDTGKVARDKINNSFNEMVDTVRWYRPHIENWIWYIWDTNTWVKAYGDSIDMKVEDWYIWYKSESQTNWTQIIAVEDLKWDTWPQWEKGDTWEKGDKWDKWDKGNKWDKGDKGDKWDTGAQWPQGEQGIQWIQWEPWDAFQIYKTYASISAMNADKANVPEWKFVMIASTVEDPDNAKLYVKADSDFVFLTDMSGATGIQWPQWEQGIQGIQWVPWTDWYSPTATVNKVWDTATVTITDRNWTTTAEIHDGEWTWDVVWPNSSYDDDITVFDWTTWKLIKDSGKGLNEMQDKLTAWTDISIDTIPSGVVTISGTDSILLENARKGRLNSVNLYGLTQQPSETYIDSATIYGGTEQKSDLPDGYTQLSYIEGWWVDTSSRSYIDTGITPTANTLRVKYKGQSLDTYWWSYMWAVAWTTPRWWFRFFNNANTGDLCVQTYSYTYSVPLWNNIFEADITINNVSKKMTWYINNTVVNETNSGINLTFNKNMLIHGIYLWDAVSTWVINRCYYCQIEKDGVLVRDFVPAKRNSDNVIGYYDKVSETFFTNDGPGSFTAWGIVPTVETPMPIITNNGELKLRNKNWIPFGYTELTYIASNASGLIDTGYIPNTNTVVKAGVYAESVTSNNIAFGTRTSWTYETSTNQFYSWIYKTGSQDSIYYYSWRARIGIMSQPSPATYYDIECANTSMTTDAEYPITIFGLNIAGTISSPTRQRSKYFQIYDNWVLIKNLIPAMRNSDSVVGMYDTVNNTFIAPVSWTCVAWDINYDNYELYTDWTVETVTDSDGSVATAEMLLAVWDYVDEQELLSGNITRNVGVLILNGTETWTALSSSRWYYINIPDIAWVRYDAWAYCTHLNYVVWTTQANPMANNSVGFNRNTNSSACNGNITFKPDLNTYNTVESWKNFLANQYANWTPVIVVHPILTSVSETVAKQRLRKAPVTVEWSIADLTSTIVTNTYSNPDPIHPLDIISNNWILKADSNNNVYADGTTETVRLRGRNMWDAENLTVSWVNYTITETTYGFTATAQSSTSNSSRVVIYADSDFFKAGKSYVVSGLPSGYKSVYVWRTVDWTNDTSYYKNGGTGRSFTITDIAEGQTRFIVSVYLWKSDQWTVWDFSHIQIEEWTTSAPYEPPYYWWTATAEMLLSCDTYYDEQDIISWDITYNIKAVVITWNESWDKYRYNNGYSCFRYSSWFGWRAKSRIGICTHFEYYNLTTSAIDRECCAIWSNGTVFYIAIRWEDMTVEEFKQRLADQKTNWTPVIFVFPLYTPIESATSAQTLDMKMWDNVIEVTQASLNNLWLSADYERMATNTISFSGTGYQTVGNMSTSLSNPDDTHYPTTKAVADAIQWAWWGDMMSSTYDPNGVEANVYDYNNFINTPTIPSKTSDLTNDSGFITNSYHDSTKQDTLSTQTAYTNKGTTTKVPQISTNTLWQVTSITEVTITQPTKTSDLTNDSWFITSSALPTKVSDLTNDSWFLTSSTWVTSVNGSNWAVTVTVPTKVSDLTNDSWYTTNTGTITSVKMNGSTVSSSWEADLWTVITSHQSIKTINNNSLVWSGNVTINEPIVNSTAPSSPTEWMIWYDTTNDVLKTYDWSNWNEAWGGDPATVVSGDSWTTYTIKVSNSAPASWTPNTTITFVV